MLAGHQESQRLSRAVRRMSWVLSSLLCTQVCGAAGNLCLQLQRRVRAGAIDVGVISM